MSRLTLLEKILELEEELESLPPYDEELNQLCESQDQIQKEIYSLINRSIYKKELYELHNLFLKKEALLLEQEEILETYWYSQSEQDQDTYAVQKNISRLDFNILNKEIYLIHLNPFHDNYINKLKELLHKKKTIDREIKEHESLDEYINHINTRLSEAENNLIKYDNIQKNEMYKNKKFNTKLGCKRIKELHDCIIYLENIHYINHKIIKMKSILEDEIETLRKKISGSRWFGNIKRDLVCDLCNGWKFDILHSKYIGNHTKNIAKEKLVFEYNSYYGIPYEPEFISKTYYDINQKNINSYYLTLRCVDCGKLSYVIQNK